MKTKELKDELRKIFNKHDLIRIYENEKVNFDEYDPEIELTFKKINKDISLVKFTEILYGIFTKMFSKQIAGPRSRYKNLAKEVYELLTKN